MERFSALLALCEGNPPVTGEFPSQMPVTWSFDVFIDLCLNKRLSKQSRRWWFGTPSPSLRRHYNGLTKAGAIGAMLSNFTEYCDHFPTTTLVFTKTDPDSWRVQLFSQQLSVLATGPSLISYGLRLRFYIHILIFIIGLVIRCHAAIIWTTENAPQYSAGIQYSDQTVQYNNIIWKLSSAMGPPYWPEDS